MGLQDLEEALLQQKCDFAETDILKMIANVLQLEEGVVARVLTAFTAVAGRVSLIGPFGHMSSDCLLDARLPDELRNAICIETQRQLRRAWLAGVIKQGQILAVDPQHLIKTEAQICEGCPSRFRCIATQLSTPHDCITLHRRMVAVKVLSMKGDHVEVEARQPQGRYRIASKVLHWNSEAGIPLGEDLPFGEEEWEP